MKNTIFAFMLLVILLAVFFLINFRTDSAKNGNDTKNQLNPETTVLQPPISGKPNTVSYKAINSKPNQEDVDLKSKLIDMVEFEKDGDAAFQLISLNSVCSLSKLTDEELQNVINQIGNVLLEDPSGRNFFNQTLIYPGIEINDFEDLSKNLTNKEVSCEGFELDGYEKIFFYLNVAAEHGFAEAKVALWKMSHPLYVKHKAAYQMDSNNLKYLNFVKTEKEWVSKKRQYLKEAAEHGESRAWVLIADAMSSESWDTPNIIEAYMYYHAAAKIYDFPFIFNKIEYLEDLIEENSREMAKKRANKLVELHLTRY